MKKRNNLIVVVILCIAILSYVLPIPDYYPIYVHIFAGFLATSICLCIRVLLSKLFTYLLKNDSIIISDTEYIDMEEEMERYNQEHYSQPKGGIIKFR